MVNRIKSFIWTMAGYRGFGSGDPILDVLRIFSDEIYVSQEQPRSITIVLVKLPHEKLNGQIQLSRNQSQSQQGLRGQCCKLYW
jgi:hypothetical protein